MNAIEYHLLPAPLTVLRLGVRPDPVAGAGELLIRVSASGVNRPDVLQRTGNYPVPPGASDIPGLEVAGVIESGDVAANGCGRLQGRATAFVHLSLVVAMPNFAWPRSCNACLYPKALSDIEAASLPETLFHGLEQCV